MSSGDVRPGETTVAVDVGGTFTDVVGWDGTRLTTGKVSSTPADQSVGVVEGASRHGAVERFLHGTTVATNALLEGRTATTALVTTAGFRDVIEIGRQDRPSLYDSFADRPDPLVPRDLRFEVPAGGESTGGWQPPDEMGTVDAVAVSLIDGYREPEAEAAIAGAISSLWPELPVSRSSVVAPEFREFERTATTVMNAALSPETARYLASLVTRSTGAGLPADILVMRSSGGLLPIAEAVELPASILLSGPAGGVMAAAAVGRAMGLDHLVSFDMGGTSTDVCRIDHGRPEVVYERSIEGHPCRMPTVAIHTVGAGGGSVAWCDAGGALRVGPQSSGAVPGPAAYGRGGTEPAVTDANIHLGRIDPTGRLAGELEMQPRLAERALTTLGERLGLDATASAVGVVSVVDEVMAGAIRRVSVEEGADPRDAHLVAFGGAGGLHATSLARRLGMAGVVVPLHAGVFSAVGLLVSPPRIDVATGHRMEQGHTDLAAIRDRMRTASLARYEDAIGSRPRRIELLADVRYRGQAHELTVALNDGETRSVELWESVATAFHELHHERNGFARPFDPIEIVTVRAEAVGEPAVSFDALPVPDAVGVAVQGRRPVHTGDGTVEASVVARAGLAPGDEIVGPAIVEETIGTTYLAPGDRAVVHDTGALAVTW